MDQRHPCGVVRCKCVPSQWPKFCKRKSHKRRLWEILVRVHATKFWFLICIRKHRPNVHQCSSQPRVITAFGVPVLLLASFACVVETPAGSASSTGAKEDELLWGGVQLDPSSLASSPPPPQQQQERQQQQHQTKNKPSSAFGGPTMSPGFRRWCVQEMIRLSGHDDTTLVDYCFTLQSPAEIRESMSGTLVRLETCSHE